jgi:type I site-specific restriction endonuclease
MIKLSTYQQAVIDWVQTHVDNVGSMAALIVEAVAGSGKTFTIVKAAGLIPASAKSVFLAFNKKIADGDCASGAWANTSPSTATKLMTSSISYSRRKHERSRPNS